MLVAALPTYPQRPPTHLYLWAFTPLRIQSSDRRDLKGKDWPAVITAFGVGNMTAAVVIRCWSVAAVQCGCTFYVATRVVAAAAKTKRAESPDPCPLRLSSYVCLLVWPRFGRCPMRHGPARAL